MKSKVPHPVRIKIGVPPAREASYWMRSLFLGPLVFGIAILALLAFVPQMREIYLGIIEEKDYVRGVIGLGFVLLLCALLDYWQNMLSSAAIDRLYPDHANRNIDIRLQRMRGTMCLLTALLPLIGLGLGLLKLYLDASEISAAFMSVSEEDRLQIVDDFNKTAMLIPGLPFQVFAIGIICGALLILLIRGVRSWIKSRSSYSRSVRHYIIIAGWTVTVLAIALPLVFRQWVVPASQALGPLAMTAVVLIGVTCFLILLSYLSRRARLPITGLVMSGLVIWSVYSIYDMFSPAALQVPSGKGDTRQAQGDDRLEAAFQTWWDARPDKVDFAKGTYPVFIVAAQGGGIYATSATTAFLTELQDKCPGFSQHVFAISAVSGGAVGSAIFTALLNGMLSNRAMQTKAGCKLQTDGQLSDRPRSVRRLTQRTREVVRMDHLSPTLALIWPDIARKISQNLIGLNFLNEFNRSSVLELSFSCAYDLNSSFKPCKQEAKHRKKGLRIPFAAHWDPKHAAPALVLTSTWAETGFRAAFAPFPLHGISDGTLFSFHDYENGDFAAQGTPLKADGTLIQAAFVSARFPGIAPAWRSQSDRKWNFVDGGYVDNSGATTALELYNALQDVAKRKSLPISLHLILLTDADTKPDFSEIADGSELSDTVAPITALLSVRGQLARRAVTQAIDDLEKDASSAKLAGMEGPTKVMVVNLDQKTFQFSLGWKISRLTDDLVRLMLGRDDLCTDEATLNASFSKLRARFEYACDSDKKLQEHRRRCEIEQTLRTRRDNSCVKKRLQDLLDAKEIPEVAAHVP